MQEKFFYLKDILISTYIFSIKPLITNRKYIIPFQYTLILDMHKLLSQKT